MMAITMLDQLKAARRADEFLAFLARLAGGAVDVRQHRGHHHHAEHQHEAQRRGQP